ncbi:hypothetical protein BC826DRAFT_958792 [Russula brevipes]|nr:hypothetical protein BC826DRAFT_958792 [Russula brevipes]
MLSPVRRAALGLRLVFSRSHSSYAIEQHVIRLLKSIGPVDLPETPSELPWYTIATPSTTFDSAVAQLESLTTPSALPEYHTSTPNAACRPPVWFLVSLCSKVTSPADAEKTARLIVTNLPYVPSALRPPVLILVVHLLSTYRVFLELDRVIQLFIGLPLSHEHEHLHFNHLLRALTRSTASASDGHHIARHAVLLLKTMTDRDLPLKWRTSRLLLRNRYITRELTDELRQRLLRDNSVPNRPYLQYLLRTSAHRGSVHDATAYLRAIHHREREHLVHENSLRASFDADLEWSRFIKTGQSHRFPNKQNTTAAAWVARLLSLSRTQSFSPENLVSFFEWSHAQHFPFRTQTTLSYTIVLRSLLRQRAYALALDVWERYRKHGTRKLQLDHIVLGVGVELFTRAGHPDRALALINSLVDRPQAYPHLFRRLSARPTVPASIVIGFMRALSTTNPSAALQLWEHMGILYGTTPDARAFSFMLDAARRATFRGESFTGAMQEIGFYFRSPLPLGKPELAAVQPGSADAASLDGARRRSRAELERSLAVSEGDMWGNERAWRRAHRIFTNALLAGWPALAEVHAPAHAIRASGEDPPPPHSATSSASSSPPTTPGTGSDDDEYTDTRTDTDERRSPPILPTDARSAYPVFAPDDDVFRAAVLMLGAARAAGEIPRTLAWMRALGITPRVPTLAFALVFWAEVSAGAPLLERLRGAQRGEYARLVRWIEGWVGAENVPDEGAIGEAMRKVDAMRRGYYYDPGRGAA